MPNQPPLNPDALEAAAKALRDDHANRTQFYVVPAWEKTPHESKELFRLKANAAVSAYLAAALPEVTSVEELDALPAKTVILDSHGDVSVITETGLFMCDDGDCYELDEVADDLPARVLYRPEMKQ